MDVSDRRRHVQLTQEAEIVPDFFFIRAIFAFAGFGSALGRAAILPPALFCPGATRSGAKFFTFLPIDSPIMGWFMICLAP